MHVDPTPHPANVLGDEDPKLTVSLGAPTSLYCYAYGWPRPAVTWWRGNTMVPLSANSYEQNRDFSLLIHSVKLSNLGIYTCQVYNGLGKAASYSVTVQAIGPVYYTNPEDERYTKFLVEAPTVKPELAQPQYRPQYPYRPEPGRRPAPTPQSYIPAPYTDPNPEILPESVPEQPRVFVGKWYYCL